MTPSGGTDAVSSEPPFVPDRNSPLDKRLFIVVGLILILLSGLFVAGLTVQINTYGEGMKRALAESPLAHEAVLAYARSLDAAIVKTSALFLGFLLVFTGALYVLRIATSQYRLKLKNGEQSGSLETSSPGLVMISLGVLLIIVTILTHSTLDYKSPTSQDTDSSVPINDQQLPSKPPPSETSK